MNWKHINIGVGVVGAAAIVASVTYGLTHLEDTSSTPTTTTVTSVRPAPPAQTATRTVIAPPRTVTETSVPPASTVTQTVTVPPAPTACIQDGVDASGWDTAEDNVSEAPDTRPGVMALGNATGAYFQSGDCFDEMVVKTDTDEAVGFDVQYVDKSQVVGIASGLPVEVQGSYFLRLVMTVHVPEDQPDVFENFVFSPHGGAFPAIVDVKPLGYQEGRLAFAVGVTDKLPVAATRIANPDQPGTVAVALRVAHE